MKHILLLEDDESLGRGIAMALESSELAVSRCICLAQAEELLETERFDLLILDINLPDGSGLDLLRKRRESGDTTPIILLTAKDLELDEVTGLEAGQMTTLPSHSPWRCFGPEWLPSCAGSRKKLPEC